MVRPSHPVPDSAVVATVTQWRMTLPTSWQQPSANYWRQASRPVLKQSATGRGITLVFLKGRPSDSGEACVPPRRYLHSLGCQHPLRKEGISQGSSPPGGGKFR